MLTRSLNSCDQRRGRGLDARREGPDDLVERVRFAQNRGAVPRARRDNDAPTRRAVARGVHAIAGRPPESDAFARRLVVPDAVVVEQAHGAPQWFRVRIGRPQVPVRGQPYNMLVVQSNLANTYRSLGREEEAANMLRDVYSGRLELLGNEHPQTLGGATNYAISLVNLGRSEEAKSLLSKTIPATRRVFGGNHELTLRMQWIYAETIYSDPRATLDELREATTTLEERERTARRVLGGTHPLVLDMERKLRAMRAALSPRDVV